MSFIVRSLVLLVLMLAPVAAGAQNRIPADLPLEALVKSMLLSFNDANLTNDYSVFHAKLSKPFRDQYSPEKLAETFKAFREQNADIHIVAAMKPTYDPAPKVDAEGRLLVSGSFPTQPSRVQFDLKFIPSDGEWKLVAINVHVAPKS